jgi:FkbM family methyltransferase
MSKRLSRVIAEIQEPWIFFNPSQAFRRILQKISPEPRKILKLQTAWGGLIWCDSQKEIGRSIFWRGIFDLVLSEVLVRLLEPGSTFVDAGANIGYMSVLAARIVKSTGNVISFEPNPDIIPILQQNVILSAEDPLNAQIHVVEAALGSSLGEAMLFAPEDYLANDGIAYISSSNHSDKPIGVVPIRTLDAEMADQKITLLKVDVEGHEIEVLRGAESMLRTHQVETIIFEDHSIHESPIPNYLAQFGYRLFSLRYSLFNLHIDIYDEQKRGSQLGSKSDGAPSYLATILSSQMVRAKLLRRGWRCLRPM